MFGKADFDFWKDQEVLRGCIGAANKVHLIAGSETIEAYVRASQSWAKAIHQLSKARLKIEEVKTELKMEEDLIAMLSTHRDETLSSIKAQGTSDIQSQESHELHRKRFQDLQRQIEDSFAKKGKLHSKLARLLMQISVECVAAHVEFSEKLVAVNLAARREVDLRIDENRYREFQALMTKELQVSSNTFVQEIHGWINEQEQKLDS